MFIRIFKANYFYNFLLFPIVGLLMLTKSFLSQQLFQPDTNGVLNPMFRFIYDLNLTYSSALLINYIAIMIICFQLLYFNAVFSFVRERTFLPVYLFIFIVLTYPSLHVIQPVFIAAIFFLLAFYNIFLSFEKRKVIINGFNAGFFIGIAGLFYPGLNILVFLIPISIYTLKNKIGFRELIATILGLILPALYVFTYFFLTDNLSSFYEIYTNLFTKKNISLFVQIPSIVHLSLLALITIFASIFMLKQYDENKISTRRFYKILFFFFATSFLLIIIPSVSFELLVIVTLPLTFLLTNYFTFIKRRFWAEFFFTLLIIFSILMQFWIK